MSVGLADEKLEKACCGNCSFAIESKNYYGEEGLFCDGVLTGRYFQPCNKYERKDNECRTMSSV